MVKTQIGLGVLSIPEVLDTLGMGPGLVVVISIGVITTWSNYIIGVFKKNHPSVYGIDDVGYKLFGRAGREFFYVVFVLCEPPRLARRSIIFLAFTFHSLDLRCWSWYAGHINLTQCPVISRSLYGYLRRRCSHYWVHPRKHSDPP